MGVSDGRERWWMGLPQSFWDSFVGPARWALAAAAAARSSSKE